MLLPSEKAVNSWKVTIALIYLLSGLLGAHGHHLQLPKLNTAQDKLVKKGKHPSLLAFFPNSNSQLPRFLAKLHLGSRDGSNVPDMLVALQELGGLTP